jgi:hypothetical protein
MRHPLRGSSPAVAENPLSAVTGKVRFGAGEALKVRITWRT